MKQILGEDINQMIKEKDFQSIKAIKGNEKNMTNINDLQVKSTTKGIFMEYLKILAVSHDGSKTWGIHVTEFPKCRLLMQDFKTKESLAYNYEHDQLALAVMVAEDLNLAMTGGNDEKTVLHCLESGKTLKVLKLGIGGIGCFFQLGSVVAVSGYNELVFFDLITQKKMEIHSLKVECSVSCMQISLKKSLKVKYPQPILFVGGDESSKLTKIILPKEITEKSNKKHYNCM
jgi:hypothetical protein